MGAIAAVLLFLRAPIDKSDINEMGRLPPIRMGVGNRGAGPTAALVESSLRGEI
jgi:hypothetical protein